MQRSQLAAQSQSGACIGPCAPIDSMREPARSEAVAGALTGCAADEGHEGGAPEVGCGYSRLNSICRATRPIVLAFL